MSISFAELEKLVVRSRCALTWREIGSLVLCVLTRLPLGQEGCHLLKCSAGCLCVRANRGSGTIRQVSGTVGTLLRNSPKPSEAVPKRRRVGTIVKCRFGLQSSKDRIGLEITILEARKRKDRHPLLNRPPATPIHLPPGILLRLFSPFPPAQGRSGRRA